jgi:hypothetical protein
MIIEYTNFVKRQFNVSFVGTKITEDISTLLLKDINYADHILIDSPDDHCKYLIIENKFNEIKQGVIERSIDQHMFLRTGYSSRTPNELPVLSEWLELPKYFKKPKANYLVFVLYTYKQLLNEYYTEIQTFDFELSEDCEWGVVAILGCAESEPDPMPPITIFRNALGKKEGGNGVKLNHELYKKSVEFWSKYIITK